MPRGEYLKHSLQDIQEKLDKKGYKWIKGEYKNNKSKIVVEKDGFLGVILIGTLIRGCDVKFFFSKNPYTLANIEKWISRNTDYKLLSEVYIDAYKPLTFECPIHGKFQLSWNKMYQGRRCQSCSARNKKYTISEIRDSLKIINPNIELISNKYVDCYTKMTFRCKLDNYEWESNWHNILANNNGCPECKRQLFLGKNNPRYNAELTEEERQYKRLVLGFEYHKWRTSIFNKDNYTCQCCGSKKSGTLNAHHLDGYNWCKEKRTDVKNGITLCETCHSEFHHIYGYGNNTKEQFEDFIKKSA